MPCEHGAQEARLEDRQRRAEAPTPAQLGIIANGARRAISSMCPVRSATVSPSAKVGYQSVSGRSRNSGAHARR
jgi:hypothetical protein